MSKLELCSYEWKSKTCFLSNQVQISDIFPASQSAFKWKIQLEPDSKDNELLSLILNMVSAPNGIVKIKYFVTFGAGLLSPLSGNFEFDNRQELPTLSHNQEIVKKMKDCFGRTNPFGSTWVQYDIKINILSRLTHTVKKLKPNIVSHNCQITQLLHSLLQDHEFCDVKIQVGSVEIDAHKSILAAISPVFRATLSNDMIEKNTGRIVITGLDEDVVRIMIEFIYKGYTDIPNFTKGMELLRASDIYDIPNLKQLCSEYLIEKVNQDNVIQILLFAETYNAPNLKHYAIEFFLETPRIYLSCEFEDILKEKSYLLPILLAKMTERRTEFEIDMINS